MSVSCECSVLSDRGLCDELIACPPTVMCRLVWSRNLVNEEALAQWGVLRKIIIIIIIIIIINHKQ